MSRGDDTASPSPSCRIEIENGPAFQVGPQEDTLLRAALRAGVPFPYECSVGGCGGCRFDLIEGDMATLWEAAPGLSARDRQRGKRLACQSRPLGDCRIRVRVGTEAAEPAPVRAEAVLTGRRALTDDLLELSFRLAAPPPFRPGQYALLYPPGVTGARAYSMSHVDAGDGTWRFIVRRTPGGRGSTTLCDTLAEGASVTIDGPYGLACLRPTPRDVVCVAGGSGLGPMLSVARGVLAEPGKRHVHVFLGLRSEADFGAAEELRTLAGPRVTTTVVLSNPRDPAAWTGASGFVHAEVERAMPAAAPTLDWYFAGPPPMVEAMQELLMLRHRVPFEQIHFDRFV